MYCVIDVETTGGSPRQDRITEIAIIITDGTTTHHTFCTLLNPERPIDPYVSKMTGITDEMVKSAPRFEEVADKVEQLTRDHIFVGHNVRFDFGMLRQEFKRLGRDFNRKKIDTVTLARKAFPGHTSYSLGTICEALGIGNSARHRALGDAEATAVLLSRILQNPQAEQMVQTELNHGLDLRRLPVKLSTAEIEKLPEEPGVLYLRDETGAIQYLEGSYSVFDAAIQYFRKYHPSETQLNIFNSIVSVEYEPYGNDVVAKLVAAAERAEHRPKLALPRQEHTPGWGIFADADEHGVKHLHIAKTSERNEPPALAFSSRVTAGRVLSKIMKKNDLHVSYQLLKRMNDLNKLESFRQKVNSKVERAVRNYLYGRSDFFLLGPGIHPEEKTVVLVEDNRLTGIGSFHTDMVNPVKDNLRAFIKPVAETRETQRIIRQALRAKRKYEMIPA